MNSKLSRTILLALALGFLVVWILEFRRAGLFESYWLLLLSIVCLLVFQFSRLKAAATNKPNQPEISSQKAKPAKYVKK
jgi:hypothetical protein